MQFFERALEFLQLAAGLSELAFRRQPLVVGHLLRGLRDEGV